MTTNSTINKLTSQLSASMKKPTGRTLTLIEKALDWLRPFESPKAIAASASERSDLLALLTCHRMVLTPYLDIDRIEYHLRSLCPDVD